MLFMYRCRETPCLSVPVTCLCVVVGKNKSCTCIAVKFVCFCCLLGFLLVCLFVFKSVCLVDWMVGWFLDFVYSATKARYTFSTGDLIIHLAYQSYLRKFNFRKFF